MLLRTIPADRLEWSFGEGKLTPGDLVRHIATINRYMLGETCQRKPSRYAGCGKELADGRDAVLDFAERLHRETMEIVRGVGGSGATAKMHHA